jgi:hypothetical protein
MTTTLIQFFGRSGCFEKAVIFSYSISTKQSVAKFDALPGKRVTEIHNSVVLVRKRTILNERPQPAGEVSANFS